MYDGPRLCEPEKCRLACVNLCPVKALSTKEFRTCRIGDRVFKYPKLDQLRCMWAIWGLHKGSGSKTHLEMPEILTVETIRC
jgi:hypothetical protein